MHSVYCGLLLNIGEVMLNISTFVLCVCIRGQKLLYGIKGTLKF